MRIAFFADLYFPNLNGVTVSVENLAKELRAKGHTVYIIAPKLKNAKSNSPFVYYIPSTRVMFSAPEIRLPILMPQRGLRKVFQLDLDIIHAHGNGAFSFLGYQVARAKDIPFVLTFHGLQTEYTHYIFNGLIIKPPMVKRALRLFGQIADGVIAPSMKMKKVLLSYGLKKEVKVLPNFVPLEKFNLEEKDFLTKRLNLPKDTPIILSVGRLGKEKNFQFVVKTFKKLAEKEKKSHLVIVGDGPDRDKLIRLAGPLLNKRIHLTGAIESDLMPQVYKGADLFVFGSVTEVHPMVALEAAAAGLPLVLANDSAFDNLVFDGQNGYSLPLNPDVFAKELTKLLSDSKLRAQYSQNSKAIVEQNFSPTKITSQFVKYYEENIETYRLKSGVIPTIKKSTARILRATQKLGRIITSYS